MMMVIAVIGILAAVLIPKIQGVKDNSKMAGVDANVRQTQAYVSGMIQRYQNTTSGTAAAQQTSFANTVVSATGSLENPFTNETGAVAAATMDTTVAVTVANAKTVTAPTATDADNEGMIFVGYEQTGSGTVADPYKIDKVIITPYDNSGAPMAATEVTP
ncbi:MAG: hypothetical protein HGA27_01835 [Peptococcaceae bacterium]|nr:hypothetical protein [Peptococcaceae bacterium]